MKFLMLSALSLAILSCRSETSDTDDSPEKEVRISAEDHAALIREKIEVEKELGLILADPEVAGEELGTAREALTAAYLNLRTVQSELPALRELSSKISDHNTHLQRLRAENKESQIQMVTAEIATLQQSLVDLANEQPEVQDAQEKIVAANENLAETRRKLARDVPEARNLSDKLDALNRKLVEVSR